MSSLLSLDELRGAKVLAGSDGLGRIVSGVNIIEVPDVARWLAGGEFLLSSGYPFRQDGDSLAELLGELQAVGVAALGYKPGGWLDELPDVALAAANAFDLIEHVVSTGTEQGEVSEDLGRGLESGEVTRGCPESVVTEVDNGAVSCWLYAGERPIGWLTVRAGTMPGRLVVAEVAEYIERCIIRRQAFLDGQFAAVMLTFNLLVAGALPAHEVEERATLLGLGDGRRHAVARLQVPSGKELLRRWQVTLDLHLRDVATVVRTEVATCELTLVLRGDDPDKAVDRLHELAGRIAGDAPGGHRLGVSRSSDRVEDLSRQDHDSRIALDVARRRGHTDPVRLDAPVWAALPPGQAGTPPWRGPVGPGHHERVVAGPGTAASGVGRRPDLIPDLPSPASRASSGGTGRTVAGWGARMTSRFDRDTAVEQIDEGHFRGTVDAGWGVLDDGHPNGGYLMAIVLRAMGSLAAHPHVTTATAHFLRPGKVGSVEVEVDVVKTGRRLSTLTARMLQDDRVAVQVVAAFSDLAEQGLSVNLRPPLDLPDPSACIGGEEADRLGFTMPGIGLRLSEQLVPDDLGFVAGRSSGAGLMRGWGCFEDGRPMDPARPGRAV